VEETEIRETLKAPQYNFVIVDNTFTQVAEEMKNVVVWHDKMLTTTFVKHKEEMELVTGLEEGRTKIPWNVD
jgi:hypothetical protein